LQLRQEEPAVPHEDLYAPEPEEPPGKVYIGAAEPAAEEEAPPGQGQRLLPHHYFSMLLLLLVPIVNILVLVIWSAGKRTNPHRQSFARGALIFLLTLTLLAALALAWHNVMRVLYPNGWQFVWQ
jgi:hypothetical protein